MCWPGHLQFLPKGSLERETLIYLNRNLSTTPLEETQPPVSLPWATHFPPPNQGCLSSPSVNSSLPLCNSTHQSSLGLLPTKASSDTEYSAMLLTDLHYGMIYLIFPFQRVLPLRSPPHGHMHATVLLGACRTGQTTSVMMGTRGQGTLGEHVRCAWEGSGPTLWEPHSPVRWT